MLKHPVVSGTRARRTRLKSTVAALTYLLMVLLSAAHAPGTRADEKEPTFALYKLSVADKLLHYFAEDLDGDGLEDIVVVHRKGLAPAETRWISIFWHDARRGFSTAADRSWELDTEAVILDVGDVTGDAKKEICYLTAGAVMYHAVEAGRYRTDADTLFPTRGLAVYPSRSGIPVIDFVRDWDGDGRDDVGVFTFEGLSVYSRGETGRFSPANQISIDLETDMDRSGARDDKGKTAGLHAEYVFPDVLLVDYDNDGRDDLITTTDDKVTVHGRGEDGQFAPEATAERLFDVLTQEEKIEGFADLETVVTEMNGDGYADAVVTKQTAKGLTNFRGVVNVFWGTAGGYKENPDQVIISEGTASARTMFLDVNGDGRKDLVLPSIKFNIAAIIRILVTRSIQVNFNIFLLNADGRLSERPDFTKEVKFKIDLSGESDDQAVDLEGDYNGDKRTDFVFATNENELSVYLGVRDGDRLFSQRPAVKVNADAYGELESHDLNGDGFSDMVIYYPQNKDRQGTLEVLLNLQKLR